MYWYWTGPFHLLSVLILDLFILLCFSIDIGPVHFIMFSSEFYYFAQYGWTQIVEQYKWLEQDLIVGNIVNTPSPPPPPPAPSYVLDHSLYIHYFCHHIYCHNIVRGHLSKTSDKKLTLSVLKTPRHGRPACIAYEFMQNIGNAQICELQILRFGRFAYFSLMKLFYS